MSTPTHRGIDPTTAKAKARHRAVDAHGSGCGSHRDVVGDVVAGPRHADQGFRAARERRRAVLQPPGP